MEAFQLLSIGLHANIKAKTIATLYPQTTAEIA